MIKTTAMIISELGQYARPEDKLTRMVKHGEYILLRKGLYETDRSTPGYLLANCIYGPSYLSFEFALSYYGMIPETVHVFTSAAFAKKKKKKFLTAFGVYTYRDVPAAVYPIGLCIRQEKDRTFTIATREKAICDQLYQMRPVANYQELSELLFQDLRIDEQELAKLNLQDLQIIAAQYPCRNVRKFYAFMRKRKNEYDHRRNDAGL